MSDRTPGLPGPRGLGGHGPQTPLGYSLPPSGSHDFSHGHNEQLQRLWQEAKDEIDMTETDTAHFKNQTLPLARIKKIMKSDEDVRMISAEAPVLFAKACEFFVLELTQRAWQAAEESKRRTLQRCDIAQAIQRIDVFDFLLDIVPYEEPPPDSGASPAAGPGSLPPAAAQGPTSHAGAVPPDPQYQGQQQARMGHYGTGLRYAPQQGMAYGQPPPQYHPGMYPPPQQYPYPSYPPVMGQGAPYSSVPGSYPPSPSLGGRPSGMGQ